MIRSVVLDCKKSLTIEGARFGMAPRGLVDEIDKSVFINSISSTVMILKGKARKSGLKPGEHTIKAIGEDGASSNIFAMGMELVV
jgi:hypothetical protein